MMKESFALEVVQKKFYVVVMIRNTMDDSFLKLILFVMHLA